MHVQPPGASPRVVIPCYLRTVTGDWRLRPRERYEVAGSGGGGCIAAPGIGRGCGLSSACARPPALRSTLRDDLRREDRLLGLAGPQALELILVDRFEAQRRP